MNKISADLLRRAMPIQDSSIKDELIYYLELYGTIPIQYSSLKDELVLRHRSSSKIQDSYLKDELVLICSPSKFIDGHCNIS